MEIIARSKYIRTSPRKVRLIAGTLKGLPVKEAVVYLEQIGKRATLPIRKAVNSAFANAKNNLRLPEDQLRIKNIEINEGPTYKRVRPISRGQSHPIAKRTSHIKVVLEAPGQ